MDVPSKGMELDVLTDGAPASDVQCRQAEPPGGALRASGLTEGEPTVLSAMTPPPESNTSRGPAGNESWSDRCARLFDEMRRPARAMVARAYGRSLSDDEIEDVYSAAWAATLSALRDRGNRMEEGELRAYLLTAVASHASKEMRRRSRDGKVVVRVRAKYTDRAGNEDRSGVLRFAAR
jgi:hypothetical protein